MFVMRNKAYKKIIDYLSNALKIKYASETCTQEATVNHELGYESYNP